MSRTFKVWLDSGANCQSCYEQEVSLEDLGLSSEEFDEMSDEEKDSLFREIAWDRMDWGWTEK